MSSRSWIKSPVLAVDPAGRVRLLAPRLASKMVVPPRLEQVTRDYPDVLLEIMIDDSRLDFAAGRFDAGTHLGEFIARDMIAVRVSQEQRAAIVAAPRYFESHLKPKIGVSERTTSRGLTQFPRRRG